MLRSAPTGRLAALGLLCVTGVVGIYLAARAGGATAALLAGVALASGIALVARTESEAIDRLEVAQVLDGVLLLLPGALIVFFSFNTGGYFPDVPALAVIALVVVLVLRLTLVDDPLAGVSIPLVVAAAALGLFAIWTLLSALWSDSTARTLIEFDRALVYLLVLVICGSVARSAARLRLLAGGLALGSVVVATAALATRLLPDRFPTSIPAIGESNLAYPLTYSNALGIVCVIGAIPCLYFATSTRLPRTVRVAGAAALPLFATTVYLTLSRGPVAAAIIGIVAFVVLGRPRGLVGGLVAIVPTSIIAVASAYQHPVLTSNDPQAAAATSQGRTVALVVAACVVGAALLRLVMTPLDRRLRDFRLPPERRLPIVAGGWAALVIALIVLAIAVDAPGTISDQYDRFVSSGQASPGQTDIRQSVFSSANRGIVDNWRVARDAFEDAPLRGQGAGSYENYWNQHRPARQVAYYVTDAHSLYVEVLGELGLVGFLLIAVLVLAILGALLPVRRGPNRALYAALFATALAWVAHAGVDWDWEMPAVTVGAIGLGGAALASHQRDVRLRGFPQGARVVTGILLLGVAITPALLLTSQRQLNEARDLQRQGECRRAIDRAADAINTLEVRPEPYEVMAVCQQRLGKTGFAIQAMEKAVERDPDNWRYHFQLGVLLGGASQNTRPELLTALRLNPHNTVISDLLREAPEGTAVNWDLELLGPGGALEGQ